MCGSLPTQTVGQVYYGYTPKPNTSSERNESSSRTRNQIRQISEVLE